MPRRWKRDAQIDFSMIIPCAYLFTVTLRRLADKGKKENKALRSYLEKFRSSSQIYVELVYVYLHSHATAHTHTHRVWLAHSPMHRGEREILDDRIVSDRSTFNRKNVSCTFSFLLSHNGISHRREIIVYDEIVCVFVCLVPIYTYPIHNTVDDNNNITSLIN